jgi:PKD repeat protein
MKAAIHSGQFLSETTAFILIPGGFDEVAVVKLDTNGQVLWTHALHFNTPVKAVCLDSHGSAYLGMEGLTQQIIFGNDTLVNNFGSGAYSAILKWDSIGTPVRGIGIYPFSSQPDIYDLAANAQDELLVSGSDGAGNNSINGDTVVYIDHTSYLFKFDAAGNFVWHKAGPSSWVYGDGIAVRNGNEYIQGGSTGNTGTFTFGCLQYTTAIQSNFVSFISELPEWNPVASFTFSVVNDTTYNFIDQSTDATSWHWDFGDGDTSNAQNPSHDFIAGGNYPAILTVYHGICSSIDTVQIVGVGISEIATPVSFTLSPNPAGTDVILHFDREVMRTIQLKNFLGEIILEAENSSAEIKMDISYLPEAIYFITVMDKNNNSVTKKIVKM